MDERTETTTCYAAINFTHVDEPSVKHLQSALPPQLWLISELLSFGVFPFSAHTAANIKVWLRGELRDAGMPDETITWASRRTAPPMAKHSPQRHRDPAA